MLAEEPRSATVDTGNLTAEANAGLDCMRQSVAGLGGNFTLNSAYRPVSYQEHLREVWDAWTAIRNKSESECAELKSAIRAEFTRHGLLLTQRPAAGNPNAPHARGVAFDASIRNLPSGNTVDTVAAACNMYRPWPGIAPAAWVSRVVSLEESDRYEVSWDIPYFAVFSANSSLLALRNRQNLASPSHFFASAP